MIRAYIAGPYRAPTTAGIGDNIATARRYALALWAMRIPAYCPHMNTAHFDGGAPDEVWLEGHLEWMRQANFVLVLPRGEGSTGTVAEVREALRLGMPAFWAQVEPHALQTASRIHHVRIRDDDGGRPEFACTVQTLHQWLEETPFR